MTGKATIKYLAIAAAVLWLGCIAAYLAGAMLFTTAILDLLPEILLPAAILAVVSLVAGLLAPQQARSLALVTAFPTVAMSAILSVMLIAEGRFDISWLVVGIAAVAICLAGAQLACSLKPVSGAK